VEVNIIATNNRSPPPKRAVNLSMFYDMLIIFFDIQCIVLSGLVPSGQTVNQQNFIEFLTK